MIISTIEKYTTNIIKEIPNRLNCMFPDAGFEHLECIFFQCRESRDLFFHFKLKNFTKKYKIHFLSLLDLDADTQYWHILDSIRDMEINIVYELECARRENRI
jgi:hypothetical protein